MKEVPIKDKLNLRTSHVGEYQEIKESESIEDPTVPEKNPANNNKETVESVLEDDLSVTKYIVEDEKGKLNEFLEFNNFPEMTVIRLKINPENDIKETVDPVLKDDLSVTKYILEQERGKLNEFLEFNDLPEMTVLRQKTIVAALAAMVCDLEDKDSESEPQSQPEFPILKNNDQRKKWLADYKAWGLWYRDEHIDVNYYKYDFPDGSRLVVTEYPERYACWIDKRRDEHYYHLMEKDKKNYKKTYDEQYRHLPDPETYLVEFLKNIQKKG